MPTRETRNSTLGRGSVVGSDTTPKKGLPMIRNKSSTHGSNRVGREIAALNGGIGGNISPPLISCSKCGRDDFKSKAGLTSHLRRKVPCDNGNLSAVSISDPPAKSPPTPPLTTGGGNVVKALVGLLIGLLVGLVIGVFDALLGLAIGLLVGLIVGAFDTLRGCLPFGGSACMAVRAPEVKADNTVSDPREADVEALLKKWNGENPKKLARQILLSISERPTSALVAGVAEKLGEPNFDIIMRRHPTTAAEELVKFICHDAGDDAGDNAGDDPGSPSVSRELFPEKRGGGLVASIFRWRSRRPSMSLKQVVAGLKGLEKAIKGVKDEQKRQGKQISTVKTRLNNHVHASENKFSNLLDLRDIAERQEQQQQLAAKIEMMSPNEI